MPQQTHWGTIGWSLQPLLTRSPGHHHLELHKIMQDLTWFKMAALRRARQWCCPNRALCHDHGTFGNHWAKGQTADLAAFTTWLYCQRNLLKALILPLPFPPLWLLILRNNKEINVKTLNKKTGHKSEPTVSDALTQLSSVSNSKGRPDIIISCEEFNSNYSIEDKMMCRLPASQLKM